VHHRTAAHILNSTAAVTAAGDWDKKKKKKKRLLSFSKNAGGRAQPRAPSPPKDKIKKMYQSITHNNLSCK
jgi:hypothetical protein